MRRSRDEEEREGMKEGCEGRRRVKKRKRWKEKGRTIGDERVRMGGGEINVVKGG